MDELVNSAINEVDCLHSLVFELIKLPILDLNISDLFKLLIKFLMVGVQYYGLKGESWATNCEDADW